MNYSARNLGLFTVLMVLFPPPSQAHTGKKAQYVECCIPKLMAQYSANLSQLSPLLSPDQAMVNDVIRQLSEGESCSPAYTPFVIANLAEDPWKPQLSTHDRPLEEWQTRMNTFRSSQPLSFQAYIYYSLRFILAAHLCSAWSEFGGVAAQFNLLAIIFNISIVENIGIAIAYDQAIRKYVPHLARQRRKDVDFSRLLSEGNAEIKKHVYAQRADPKPEADRPKAKGKGKGSKAPFFAYAAHSHSDSAQGNRFRKWTPKRDFKRSYEKTKFRQYPRWGKNADRQDRSKKRSYQRSRSRRAKSRRSSSNKGKKNQPKKDEKK